MFIQEQKEIDIGQKRKNTLRKNDKVERIGRAGAEHLNDHFHTSLVRENNLGNIVQSP